MPFARRASLCIILTEIVLLILFIYINNYIIILCHWRVSDCDTIISPDNYLALNKLSIYSSVVVF